MGGGCEKGHAGCRQPGAPPGSTVRAGRSAAQASHSFTHSWQTSPAFAHLPLISLLLPHSHPQTSPRCSSSRRARASTTSIASCSSAAPSTWVRGWLGWAGWVGWLVGSGSAHSVADHAPSLPSACPLHTRCRRRHRVPGGHQVQQNLRGRLLEQQAPVLLGPPGEVVVVGGGGLHAVRGRPACLHAAQWGAACSGAAAAGACKRQPQSARLVRDCGACVCGMPGRG